jgi:hypothetical protein
MKFKLLREEIINKQKRKKMPLVGLEVIKFKSKINRLMKIIKKVKTGERILNNVRFFELIYNNIFLYD